MSYRFYERLLDRGSIINKKVLHLVLVASTGNLNMYYPVPGFYGTNII